MMEIIKLDGVRTRLDEGLLAASLEEDQSLSLLVKFSDKCVAANPTDGLTSNQDCKLFSECRKILLVVYAS